MDGAAHTPWRRRLGLLAIACVAVASGLDAPKTWEVKSSPAKVVIFALP